MISFSRGIEKLMMVKGLAFVALLVAASPSIYAGEFVKKSSSGICHDSTSAWYGRTTNFTPFSSLGDCIRSGGRLPKGAAPSEKPSINEARYSRDKFGHGWDDADSDCQNERHESLINASLVPVSFASEEQCRVTHGRWISPFTGNLLTNARSLDVDHVVPLSWAWRHGAKDWEREKREEFANDHRNLWPVEASLNRQKSDQGVAEWLPPANKCEYISRFRRVVILYRLKLSREEGEAYSQILARHCH